MDIEIQGNSHSLSDGVTVIGRGEDADIRIDSSSLSRLHARFVLSGGTITVEDLGSKNGTQVNGTKISGQTAISKGDTVKVADIECRLIYAAAPQATPQAKSRPDGNGHSRVRKSKNSEMIKKMIIAAVAAAVLIAGYVYISGLEPQALKNARMLMDDVEAEMETVAVSDNIEANADMLEKLASFKSDLKTGVPSEYREAFKRTAGLISEIDEHISALDMRNRELEQTQRIAEAIRTIETTAADFKNKSLDLDTALRTLENIAAAQPRTEAGQRARKAIADIRAEVTAAETAVLEEAVNTALAKAREGDFRMSLNAIDTALAHPFRFSAAEANTRLTETRTAIIGMAVKQFTAAADKAVADARTEDCGRIQFQLTQVKKLIDLPEIEGLYTAAMQKIDAIKNERMARARARLAKELEQMEGLIGKRMYAQAAEGYAQLLKTESEPELMQELRRKLSDAELLTIGKKLIMDFVNKQKGMRVENVGFIASLSEQSVNLEVDGVSMALTWDKLRDEELNYLLKLALEKERNAEGWLAYALLLQKVGKGRAADEAILTALNMSAQIRNKYPDLAAAALAGLRKRREEALAERDAKKEADAARRTELARNKVRKITDFAFDNLGIGGAGGIFTPASSPVDSNFMLFSCDMTGCNRSDDGGKTWRLIDHRQMRDTHHCKPWFHGKDVNIVVWRDRISRDKGWNWKPFASGTPPWGDGRNVKYTICNSAPDPVICVGTAAGIWEGRAGGGFSQLLPGACAGMVILPEGLALAAVNNTVYRWIPGDGKPQALPKQGLSGSIIALAAGGTAKKHVIHAATNSGVFTSLDSGQTWKQTQSQSGLHDVVMAVNQTAIAYSCTKAQVYTTLDTGTAWKSSFDTAKFPMGPTNAELTWVQDEMRWCGYVIETGLGVSQGKGDLVMISTQAEWYVSYDAGKTWTGRVNEKVGNASGGTRSRGKYKSIGLEVTSCWDYYINPYDPKKHYCGFSDIGLIASDDRGNSWAHSTQGCPWGNTFYDLAFDPFNKERIFAASSNKHEIISWIGNTAGRGGDGGVCVSENSGAAWKPLTGLPNLPACGLVIDEKLSKPNALVMYVTMWSDGVYKSTDSGKTWTKKPGVGNPGNYHVFQIDIHPVSRDIFVSVSASRQGMNFPVAGGLWKSSDGGDTWTDITKQMDIRWANGFDFHPVNPNIIYLTASATPKQTGAIYKTTDGGKNWKRHREADFPEDYISGRFVTVDPEQPAHVYFSTHGGLYLSTDSGVSWKILEGVPHALGHKVAFDPLDSGTIYVTTGGGGIFRGPKLGAR
ncbi:FHA domain-containing protein [Planctomycetota bacterium]